jgi:hypothetical protein
LKRKARLLQSEGAAGAEWLIHPAHDASVLAQYWPSWTSVASPH